jgi:hypothetical protein
MKRILLLFVMSLALTAGYGYTQMSGDHGKEMMHDGEKMEEGKEMMHDGEEMEEGKEMMHDGEKMEEGMEKMK